MRTFFDSTQSKESKYEVCAQEFYTAKCIKTYLDNALYLSSLLSDLRMFKVSHQIINEKTVQVYCTLHCTLVFFMIAFKHTPQQCSENDLVTAESKLVAYLCYLA